LIATPWRPTVNTPCPPPHSTKCGFFGGDIQRAVLVCLGEAATVEQCLPHSRGRVTCLALHLSYFFVGLHLSKLRGNNLFYFALYIIILFPHTNTDSRNSVKPVTRIGHYYFLQPSLVLVDTFKPKSLPSRHYPALPIRPAVKAHFCV
jgi:hypothetical protein